MGRVWNQDPNPFDLEVYGLTGLMGFGLQINPIGLMGSGSYPNPSIFSNSSSSYRCCCHPLASRPTGLAGGERSPPAAVPAAGGAAVVEAERV